MMEQKSWKEFRDSGLVWWINMILHTFGWAIVVTVDGNGDPVNAFPARVKFRGFSEDITSRGYEKVSTYLAKNAEVLRKETFES